MARTVETLLAVAFGALLAVCVNGSRSQPVVYVNPPVCNLTLYPDDETQPVACEAKPNAPEDGNASEPKE